MRFRCSKTTVEREREKHVAYHRKLYWHDHFVLWPRRVDDYIVWLESVDRKGTKVTRPRVTKYGYTIIRTWWEYQYRLFSV